MKLLRRKGFALFLLYIVVGISIGIMGTVYFQYVSREVYAESTGHLVEIYSQVNNTFRAFLEKNWGDLRDWSVYIREADDEDTLKFINERQEYWNFSGFYFIASDGTCITPDGTKDVLELGEAMDRLLVQRESIMEEDFLPAGEASTVFAIPVSEDTYRGFDYTAIAICYINSDMLRSLDVDAFSGQSRCFVVHKDGRVLLSTQQGDNVFSNYFAYLRAGSDLDEEELTKVAKDWEEEVSGIAHCQIGGVSHYISYQPIGYENCMLLGVVPEEAASASLREIQEATLDVMVKVFLLVGTVLVMQFLYQNRKKLRKSALEIQYREQMFDTLSNNVDDIFLMLDDKTWKPDYISPNVERLLGIPLEAVEKNVRLLEGCTVNAENIISKEDLLSIPVHESRRWEQEHVHQRTGESLWYQETIYHESIQGMEKFIIVMSDRTQERQMNQNLQQALDTARSANEAKSHFLSNMSHDIRTPMNAIIGFTVLLEKDAGLKEKVQEYTRKIEASGRHLLNLINDVLDMSKIESGKTSLHVTKFCLSEVLDELYTILLPQARAKDQNFEIHIQGHPAEQLLGDRLRINQILINLLSNAIKYTPNGGSIDFTVEELQNPSPQYASLRFVVQDNGIGMSPEFLKTVFDPFSREANSTTSGIQGTGLGMAITKNLVELLGGVIHVTSEPGAGSVFTVELSFALPEPSEGEKSRSKDVLSGIGAVEDAIQENVLEGLLFLVAEDNDLNAEILSEMLNMEGAKCELAANGQEALEMFRSSEENHYDMILMDVQMPVMDGYAATRQIRACKHPRAGSIPIVAMTANAFAEDVRNALDCGMNGHLAKPVDMDMVKKLLGQLRKEMQTVEEREETDSNEEKDN